MTSMVKFLYEVAGDVKAGKMSFDEALKECGDLIDSEDLEEALAALDSVSYCKNADGEDSICIRGFQTQWTEEEEEPED